jgi:hypothetical protein
MVKRPPATTLHHFQLVTEDATANGDAPHFQRLSMIGSEPG